MLWHFNSAPSLVEESMIFYKLGTMRREGGIVIVVVMNLVVMSMLFTRVDQEQTIKSEIIKKKYHEGNYQLDYFNEVSDSSFPLVDHVQIARRNRTRRTSPLSCPQFPPGLFGKLEIPANDSIPLSLEEIAKLHPDVKRGSYRPGHCLPRHKLAIIIPYRDRAEHLQILLNHLHPILQRQQLDYTIYTVSFAGNGTFNKAKVVNAGFAEVNKDRQYDCFVFHDVDILVENDHCLYWCSEEPRQLSYYVDKFDYKPLEYRYPCRTEQAPERTKLFGGAVMFTQKVFLEVNGMSNLYWGWGGEDDDLYWRIWSKGYDIHNPYGENCRFSMIKHTREGYNKANPGRIPLVYHSIGRMPYDGLSNLRYKKVSMVRHALYVNITVEVGKQHKKMEEFLLSDFNSTKCEKVKMPWE